jgi:hypothetical protein
VQLKRQCVQGVASNHTRRRGALGRMHMRGLDRAIVSTFLSNCHTKARCRNCHLSGPARDVWAIVSCAKQVQCGYPPVGSLQPAAIISSSNIIQQRLRVTAAFKAPRHVATAARLLACKTRNGYVEQGSPGPSDTVVLLLLVHHIGTLPASRTSMPTHSDKSSQR